jgi:hypothetical protein
MLVITQIRRIIVINPHYDFESGYHSGDLVEQDAKAWLGIWKTYNDVPARYRLKEYESVLDATELWEEFCEEYGKDWAEQTRKYQYEKGWREWRNYCNEHELHPLAPTPLHVEDHLEQQREEAASDGTLHQTRFRPLCRMNEWLRYRSDAPVRYNPWIMAVLLGGAAYAAWADRIKRKLPEDAE